MKRSLLKPLALAAALIAGLWASSSAQATPVVSITSPADGDSVLVGSDVNVEVNATDDSPKSSIVSVVMFVDGSPIYQFTAPPYTYLISGEYIGTYFPVGTYSLTAVATDDGGLSTTSSVVNVTIFEIPPTVSLTNPVSGNSFAAGSGISLAASAASVDADVTDVAFYSGTNELADVTTPPYSFVWTNAPAGSYALTAVANDDYGFSTTSSVVSISVTNLPPTVSLTSPASGSSYAAPLSLTLTAGTTDVDGTVTNVAFYQGTTLLGNATAAPFTVTTANLFAGNYALTAVATDNNGLSTTSSVVNVTVTNTPALSVLQSIKTVFVIAMENHDLVQKNPTGSPQQILGNPAAPYFNSLITPGNPNAAQVSYATHMFSVAINGEHPSEPNYVWQEAGTDFGIRTDSDPSPSSHNVFTNVQHLSAQLTAAGIPWRTYQEDVQLSTGPTHSASGANGPVNIYNGTTDYNYAVKHNPMEFFPDTQNINCYPFSQFWTDLANNGIGRYNWITPDQYNEWHSSLPNGYTYQGVHYTGDQAAIAEGDNCLSIIIPQIMASAAYQDHGVIIIWTDETESTDDTNTTLPYVIISPLAKGNAYASTLPYSHASDLKTMDEIFQLAYQTNAIPLAYGGAPYLDAQNTGTNYVDGRSATIYDLSDFFQPAGHVAPTITLSGPANGASFAAPVEFTLNATAASTDGMVTNVAFYQGSNLLANVTSAPYTLTTANLFAGNYTFTAVATDDSGASTLSSVLNVTVTNTPALAILQSIKTIFVIPLENHDLVQANPTGSPEQLLGNPACPYFNSLITPGNPNAAQTAWATHYYSCNITGEHPSEPNYVWQEAGTDFGIQTDDDPNSPASAHNVFTNVIHLSGQLTAAGIPWRTYQEDMEYSSSELASASGSTGLVNPYNGTTDYNYAVKHNPMAFFNDTQLKNCYPMTNFWSDLTNGNIGRYNWITPDQYNEMHSSLPNGFTYNGVAWTGNQAAIAEGDNALSIIIPKIMASAAYQDHGVIIIWTDETESTDDTNTTLPYVIISPMAKGNAYASTLPYSHSSDLKTMDEIFGLAYQTNAIPASYFDAQNDGKYDYVDGRSATIYDLGDFFQGIGSNAPSLKVSLTSPTAGASFSYGSSIPLAVSVTDANATVTNVSYYSGSTLLGQATTAPFSLTWPNSTVGAYAITAVAVDNQGLTATSSVVNITVTPASLTYTQNFDTALGQTGTTLPPGFTSMVIAGGNSTYEQSTPINAAGMASATADTQTLLIWNAGSAVAKSGTQTFNIGCWDSLSDRALGTDPTGTAAQVIQLSLTNNTGGTLYGVTFSYDCKCLTNGSAGTEESELPGYCFFYSTTGTNTTANWNEVGVAGTAALVNGIPTANGLCLPNFTEGTTMSSGPVTITFATPLTNNGVMYFRWADDNNVASSPDQMIAIDNINIVSYTPSGPVVNLTAPASGTTVTPGSSLILSATATETGNTITNVAFFAGSTLLGNVTASPYTLTWPNVPAGNYMLAAVATDASGLSATSAVVKLTVAYVPPTVSLTSPANGATYAAPATVPLAATVADTDGTVTNVSYYQGTTLLASISSAPYTYSWANVSAGSYSLTATATDNNGTTATSSVVNVTVGNSPVTSFTGNYTQNFDLALSNNATVQPPGFSSLVIAGSHSDYTAANPITSAAIASATLDTQPLIVWNFGSAVTDSGSQNFNVGCSDSLNDRALGTDPTGTAAQIIQLAMTNNSGGTLLGVTFSYDCKCLTNGSAGSELGELPGYCFFYSLTGSTLAGDWNEVGAAGNVPGATNSAGLPIADGLCLPNYTQGTTMSSGPVTITFPTPLTNGGVMYFRWADDNNIADSPDSMYAIDNINIAGISASGPMVNISSPTNGQNFIPGTGVTISVNATDSTTNLTTVGLYVDGSLAYTFTSPPYILPIPGGEIPPGSYTLSALATDAAGLTATSAVVNITIAYVPPTVSLTNPAAGTTFAAFSSIPLAASAASADGSVTNVAFYQGSTLIANVTSAPFNYAWGNVSAGSYNLTALATDSHGLTATSSVVNITVTNGFGLTLTSPANNANYQPGSSIALAANAYDASGTITNVEFYANGTDLGGATTAPYTLTWPNVPGGVYALTAVASDASGLTATSSVVNISVAAVHVPPTVSLIVPTNGATINVANGLLLTATAASSGGTVTNVAFFQNGFFVANVTTAPYKFNWTNAPSGIYTLTAVATDNVGASSTSSAVSITASNSTQIATIQQIKTIFVIPLENHDLVQANPTGSPEQILGNPAAPYFNSLITPGNPNAAQTAWATHYYSCAINGEHPSEPNYVWSEAGTDFGVRTDNDPAAGNNQWSNVQHLSGQLLAAGIPWRDYQEDMQYSSSELVSASGSGVPVNPYNGTTEYNYAVKHNPMAFFTDTQNKYTYPMTNLWTDLANNTVGRYNWITPDQYNEMHSSLPSGFTYNGTAWTGDQAAIAEGDNALSIIVPKIMASQAYKDHGVIIIWTDETESTDDTNTTLPYVIISPLAKGNAYASPLPYSHSSDLKTMDELFGLAYQTNAIPGYLDAQNTGINYVNGSSAVIYDLSDFFTAPAPVQISGLTTGTSGNFQLTFSGPTGQTYEVLASTDLTLPQSAWTVVATGTFNGTNVVFTDTNTAGTAGRYFVVKAP